MQAKVFSKAPDMALGGCAAMGSRLGESKKELVCGICEPKYSASRDYMKTTNFPKKHPGKHYIERGEWPLSFALFQPPRLAKENVEETEEALETRETREVEPPVIQKNVTDSQAGKEDVSNKQLMETILAMQNMMEKQFKIKFESGIVNSDTRYERNRYVIYVIMMTLVMTI